MSQSGEVDFKRIEQLNRISWGFQQSVVLNTAAELELFTLLNKDGPLDAKQVAEKLELDERATDVLLHALAGMELLVKDAEGNFSNAPVADELLVRGGPVFQGDIIRHSHHLMERWVLLPEVLRTGRPANMPAPMEDKVYMRDFILGMANIARLSVGAVLDALDLDGARRMLDAGGGPGTYAIEFCRRHQNLTAVIFDRPQVIAEITTEQVQSAGLAERIECRGGDYLTDDLGSGYDLVLLSNIIHSMDDGGTLRLLQNCAAAMVPGGRLVLKDFLLEEDRANPSFASMFAVNMLVGTPVGKSYTVGEARDLLNQAGLRPGELIDLGPQNRILVGVKK